MVNQHKGMHHLHLRKRIHKHHEAYPHPDRFKRFYDKFIYVVVFVAPITNIPQVWSVWAHQDASGVSAFSWGAFSIISITWLIYGFLHKDKHIIIMNAALFVMQVLIAVGAIVYG